MLYNLILWSLTAVFAFNLILYLLGRLTTSDIKQKTVLITGCDSGFGNQLAFKCLKHKLTVFAGCLTEKGKTELEKQAKHLNIHLKLHAFLLDVTSDESVQQAFKHVESLLNGRVNNAGVVGQNGWDDWMNVESYRASLEVNTLGLIRVTQVFKPLVKKTRGRIINMASACGRVALPCMGPYNVSKYGVEAYSDTIRAEMSEFGVKVCILEPGFFVTGLTNPDTHVAMLENRWKRLPTQVHEEYGKQMLDFSIAQVKNNLNKLCSERTDLVVDAYFHALTSFWPRRRYQVGWDCKLFFHPFSFLPALVQDNIYKLIKFATNMPKINAVK